MLPLRWKKNKVQDIIIEYETNTAKDQKNYQTDLHYLIQTKFK